MDPLLAALRSSVTRLHDLVSGLDDSAIESPAYPADWTVAQTLSHIGSGAVIQRAAVAAKVAGTELAPDFNQSVWDEWNAKAPRAQADDVLVADAALVDQLEALTDGERAGFTMSMGPMTLDLETFVGLRLNEHAFHTWDVEVVGAPAATIPSAIAAFVVDRLDMVARFSAKPTGATRTITVRTTDPERGFTIDLTPDSVSMSSGDAADEADLVLPAEAFARLVYGRLDAAHTSGIDRGEDLLATLRQVFPGV